MANLIVISGPQAVGKMTVAEESQKSIGYRVMTNHYSIEQSIREDGSIDKEKSEGIRRKVFEETIEQNGNLIFTFVVDYSDQSDHDYIDNLRNMFEKNGGKFIFVELSANLEERLKRNVTENRLQKKASKNNIERSTKELIESMKKYRLNSLPDEYLCPNHLKLDNTYLSPEEAANIILDYINNILLQQKKDSQPGKK